MRVGSFLVTLGIAGSSLGCPLLEKSSHTDSVRPTPDVATVKPAPLSTPAETPKTQAAPPVPAATALQVPVKPAQPEPASAPSVAEIPELPPDPAAPADLSPAESEPLEPEETVEPEKPVPNKNAPSKPEKPVFELASIGKETWIYAEPRWKSQRIGYLRAGATVVRKEKPRTRAHCAEGWYAIEPRGYVCVGTYATLDVHHAVAEAAHARPVRGEGLPYTYVAILRRPCIHGCPMTKNWPTSNRT